MRLLEALAALNLPDAWIGAGVVRGAVWDHLHGRAPTETWDDVDVVWFTPAQASPEDATIETRLRAACPAQWSVHNQAHMHTRNGDAPYRDTEDAIRHWPETATSVAARIVPDGIEILAPHGLADLFALVLRPTPAFSGDRRPVFEARVRTKRWLERWPLLTLT